MPSGPAVFGFTGEDRGTPERLLEPRKSPDALNADYRFGLLGRRPEPVFVTVAPAPLSDLGEFEDIPGDPFYGWNLFRMVDGLFMFSVFSDVGGLGLVRWFGHAVDSPGWDFFPILPGAAQARDHAHVRVGVTDLLIGGYSVKYREGDMYRANPFPVDHGSVMAAAGGTGPLNGFRRYFVVRRDSVDGSESILEDLPVENASAAVNGEITIGGWATGDLALDAADKLVIYATATNSTSPAPGPFYFLAEIDNTQATFVDDVEDGVLTSRRVFDEFRGEIPEQATDAVMWDDRLWVSTFNALSYSERYTADLSVDGLSAWSRMYFENFLSIDSPFESIVDAVVSDAPRGIVKMVPMGAGGMLVFTTRDVYLLEGTGPGQYRLRLLYEGMGTPARETIVSTGQQVVYLHPRGIVVMSAYFRDGYQVVGRDEMQLMGVALDDDVETYRSVAAFDEQRNRYMLNCRPKDSSSRLMVVLDLDSGSMARWDFNASAMIWTDDSLFFFGGPFDESLIDLDGYIYRLPENNWGGDGALMGVWRYRTPKFSLDGDPATEVRAYKLWMWFAPVSGDPAVIDVKHYADGALAGTYTMDPTKRVDYALLRGMAREHWFEFELNTTGDNPFGAVAIEGYQIQIERASAKES